MPIQRTQVNEPGSNISVNPVADVSDRTIISKAPNITSNGAAQAFGEFADNFIRGFTAIKKAEVEADIPMGEKYYLESGIDGLYAAGASDLEVMAKMVQEHKLTEEHSVGTRIGFERAAGRSVAYREQSRITEELDKLINSAQGVDDNGVPVLPTGQSIEQAIANIRAKNYGLLNTDPNAKWFVESPYAAEEYNRLMRTFVPNTDQAYKQKARERITEQKRVLLTEDLVNMIANGQSSDQIGEFVNNEVRLGSIQDPKKFLIEAYKIAGLKMMNDNPQMDAQELMSNLNNRMKSYNYKGARLDGIYLMQAQEALSNEARQRDTQRINDKNLAIRKGVDQDISRSGLGPEEEGATTSLSSRLTSLGSNATQEDIITTTNKWVEEQSKLSKDKGLPYYFDVAEHVKEPFLKRSLYGIQANNLHDNSIKDQVYSLILNDRPDFERARSLADNVLDPSNKYTIIETISNAKKADIPNLLKRDLTVKSEYDLFKNTSRIAIGDFKLSTSIRSDINNRTNDSVFNRSWNQDNYDLINGIANINEDTSISPKERSSKIKELISSLTKNRQIVAENTVRAQESLELKLREHESKFSDATKDILDAQNSNVIDVTSARKLLTQNENLIKNVTPNKDRIRQLAKRIYLEEASLRLERANNALYIGDQAARDKALLERNFLSSKVIVKTLPNGGTISQLTVEAEAELGSLTDAISTKISDVYSNPFIKQEGSVKIIKDPAILRSSSSNVIQDDMIKGFTNDLLPIYLNDKIEPKVNTPNPDKQVNKTTSGTKLER